MAIFPWKRNQTLPAWQVTVVTDAGAGYPLAGLTSATLRWANSDVIGAPVYAPAVNSVTVIDPVAGIVQYPPSATDVFVTKPGNYLYEWTFTFASGISYTDTMSGPTVDS